MSSKVIALIDCDSFFASCEQLRNPSLLNKPVCVLSNNDGCVIARSKEAKILGVKMGMPTFQAKQLYKNVNYISGDLKFYGDISGRVMQILMEISPLVEIYSIDEAFIDLTGLRKLYRRSYLEIASFIKSEIKNKVGVPVSVGVSTTKTLAKLATERAKKMDGFYKIGFREIDKELKATELLDIWGIGSNTAALLNKFGIYTAYDFTKQNESWIKKLLGKKGLELKLELLGESVYPISDELIMPKSIQKTCSFPTFTSDAQYIKNSLHYHSHRACKKLRKLGLKTQTVGIMLRTKDFMVFHEKLVLVSPTDWEFEIFEASNKLFEQLYNPYAMYRSSGVILENLTEISQLSLFNSAEKNQKQQNLAKTWDCLEVKYGKNIIKTGFLN
jgi:DNA polymerase-4/DNA polymerase V